MLERFRDRLEALPRTRGGHMKPRVSPTTLERLRDQLEALELLPRPEIRDVYCLRCGHRFQANIARELVEDQEGHPRLEDRPLFCPACKQGALE